MGENTAISWCDRTWSPWYGCTQVSLGPHGACEGCYARFLSETRFGRVVFGGPGRGTGTRDIRAEAAWREPLRWERAAAEAYRAWTEHGHVPPEPETFVFPSMCDPFDNHPALTQPRRRFFDLIRATPHLTWLLLTKRPQNIVRLYGEAHLDPPDGGSGHPWPRNAAIGFTAVTQPEMDRDSQHALAAFQALNPAFIFWSGEPLLGPVVVPEELLALAGRFWAITGGETDQGAHKARPTHPDWFRYILDQCAAAGVPYHHKQNGEWAPLADHDPDGQAIVRVDDLMVWPDGHVGGGVHSERGGYGSLQRHVGKARSGRLLDGVTHDARPEVR